MQLTKPCVTNGGTLKQNPSSSEIDFCSKLMLLSLQVQVFHLNPLPVQFKALPHGQKGCVFFSGHLNLRTAPETGLPSREKNHNN